MLNYEFKSLIDPLIVDYDPLWNLYMTEFKQLVFRSAAPKDSSPLFGTPNTLPPLNKTLNRRHSSLKERDEINSDWDLFTISDEL